MSVCSVFRTVGSWGLGAYMNQCWGQWDLSPPHHVVWLDAFGSCSPGISGTQLAREEAFLPSPLELPCSSLCLVGQAGTDQKPSAMLSTAKKGHSSPAGQCLFCPSFACSCKWFIKNYSIFLLSFCTLNGQIFFSCNSVSDSSYLFALFVVCTGMKPDQCVLEVIRAVKLSNIARAVVILHKNQVSMCTRQNTTMCMSVLSSPFCRRGKPKPRDKLFCYSLPSPPAFLIAVNSFNNICWWWLITFTASNSQCWFSTWFFLALFFLKDG